MEISKKIYNVNCTPKYCFVGKYFHSWDSKIHIRRNYLQSFYLDALIDKYSSNKHYPLAIFRNGLSKKTKSSYKGTMNYGTTLSSSDSEMAYKIKKHFVKNFHVTFDKKISSIVYIFKYILMTCLIIGQKDLPLS